MSIYWFYVIGNLSACACILFWLSLVPLSILCGILLFSDYYGDEEIEEKHKRWCKSVAIFSSIMLIASIFAISSKDLMKIYVVDNAQHKWYIYYDHRDHKIEYAIRSWCNSMAVYFDSEKHAKQAVEILGEDVVKLALGVFD